MLLVISRVAIAQEISLAGEWRFTIDREDIGVSEKWYNKTLPGTILLPGSMAERMKGDDITLETKWTASIYDSSFFFRPSLAKYRTKDNLKIPFWLTPAKHYTGNAWYQKDIIVPAAWRGKRVQLFLERVHIQTRIWLDATEMGSSNSLSTSHEFDLGNLSPGKHTITICIDNRIKDMNVGPDSHSVSDQTQGNWNGIIGKMFIKALPDVFIENVQVYPDTKKKLAKIKINLVTTTVKDEKITISASAESFNGGVHHKVPAVNKLVSIKKGDTIIAEIDLPMTDKVLLWDEFNPNLYRLTVKVTTNGSTDIKQLQFGMREFKIKGTQFIVNDKPVFLRGTLNNCEFPLTGYPAMDTAPGEGFSERLNHLD